jgi:hypothetical protein
MLILRFQRVLKWQPHFPQLQRVGLPDAAKAATATAKEFAEELVKLTAVARAVNYAATHRLRQNRLQTLFRPAT